ncbi:MAG: hypothetical protein LBJ59_00275 [Zoogloeaceae bacterium]|nr:hypothetical protein [Zoogloeaceae bacterium]
MSMICRLTATLFVGLIGATTFANAACQQTPLERIRNAHAIRTLPINEQPMYGERPKTAAQEKSDATFVASIEQSGVSRQQGAKNVIGAAWSYWARGDTATAMKRFNQAWLLDPENGDAYHGFAVITSQRCGDPKEIERLFLLALAKPEVNPRAHVDYGRFLWTQNQLQKSLDSLNQTLQRHPDARNARANIAHVYYLQGDAANACRWAKDARQNGDELETGFLEDMCQRAGQ